MKPIIRRFDDVVNKLFNISNQNTFFSVQIKQIKKIHWTTVNGKRIKEQDSLIFLKNEDDNNLILKWSGEDNTIFSKALNIEKSTVNYVFYNDTTKEQFSAKLFLN